MYMEVIIVRCRRKMSQCDLHSVYAALFDKVLWWYASYFAVFFWFSSCVVAGFRLSLFQEKSEDVY